MLRRPSFGLIAVVGAVVAVSVLDTEEEEPVPQLGKSVREVYNEAAAMVKRLSEEAQDEQNNEKGEQTDERAKRTRNLASPTLPSTEPILDTDPPVPTVAIPSSFQVVFQTDILLNGELQDFVVNITSEFAPLGAEQLYKLLKADFYDGSCFFRVVPGFVIQWGIAADPEMTKNWAIPIPDDPADISNLESTVCFASAGPDTRTTQLFVNLKDNKYLDRAGFTPLGQVVSGMSALRAAYNPTPGKSGGVDQEKYRREGNAWLKPKVPKINQVTRALIRHEVF